MRIKYKPIIRNYYIIVSLLVQNIMHYSFRVCVQLAISEVRVERSLCHILILNHMKYTGHLPSMHLSQVSQ